MNNYIVKLKNQYTRNYILMEIAYSILIPMYSFYFNTSRSSLYKLKLSLFFIVCIYYCKINYQLLKSKSHSTILGNESIHLIKSSL